MSPLLLAFIALVLMGLIAAGGYGLLKANRQDKDLVARIEEVTASSRPKLALATPSITKKDTGPKADWKTILTRLFGFDMARTSQYSLSWPWVILIGIVVGRIAVALGSGMFGGIAWVLQPVVTIAVCRSMFNAMLSKRVNLLRSQFPDALGLIVRAVRVGVPVSEALRAVSRESLPPTSIEFDHLADQISIGVPLENALREMADRNNLPEYGFFAAALSLQAQTGGGLSETLELLADVTRKRVAMQARGHALSAEARTSSMILGGLPLVSGASLYLINPDYMSLLFTEESGRMVLGGAVLSLCVGIFVMRTIIRTSLST
jgi:tight adherence protein B